MSTFTKDQMLDNVEYQKHKNITPFIRTMLGKELADISSAHTPKSDLPFSASKSLSRTNSMNYPAAPILQLPSSVLSPNPSAASLPSLPVVLPAIQSTATITKIEQSTTNDGKVEGQIISQDTVEHNKEDEGVGLLPNASTASFDEEALLQAQSLTIDDSNNNNEASKDGVHAAVSASNSMDMHGNVDGGNLQEAASPSVGDGTGMLNTPMTGSVNAGITTPVTNSAKLQTPHSASTPTPMAQRYYQPKVRLSDAKAPSKALAAFDEFMSTQQDRQKINLEGRRKANRNSKFRIRQINDPYADLVELKTTYEERLRTELAIFEALHPNSTKKDREEFIAKFQSIYPDLTVKSQMKEEEQMRNDNELMSRSSKSTGLGFGGFSPSKPTTPLTPNSPALGPLVPRSRQQSPIGRGNKKGGVYSDEEDDIEYDPDLEAWQKYTVKDIVSTKTGERKTLPAVTLPRSVQAVTAIRSNRANRGGNGVLVTLPAEKDELLIKGPPSYLELYKRGFRVHTSSKAKANLDELKQRAENSEIS